MPLTSDERRLLRVSQRKVAEIGLFAEGVSLENALSMSISEIVDTAVADRITLAREFLAMAESMMKSRAKLWRPAIARYYYAMYHAMRAAAMQYFRGDDHEQHSDLYLNGVPKDFPNRAIRINELKSARITRNEADYEPYPKDVKHFRVLAHDIQKIAPDFVASTVSYVRSKGNGKV